MSFNLLKGKRGIILGAFNESSIAWKIAEKAKEEGADFVLSNTAISIRLGTVKQLAEKLGTVVITADATKPEEIENLYKESMEIMDGKIDFILHSIAMSPNVRKKLSYENLNYDYFQKTLDISALSFHKMLLVAKKFDVLNKWASVVALSYIASQRTLAGYNDMAEAKAMLESIARSFGYIYGKDKKVRINTISQSPSETPATSIIDGFDKYMNFSEKMSPLGNASAEDCANACVLLFSDLSRKITMQNICNDGGFSSMGVSYEVL
jgi:enoyl-[acyl-carrier protein] reductase I